MILGVFRSLKSLDMGESCLKEKKPCRLSKSFCLRDWWRWRCWFFHGFFQWQVFVAFWGTEWRRKNQNFLKQIWLISQNFTKIDDFHGPVWGLNWLNYFEGDLSTVGIQDFCWANLPFKVFKAPRCGMASHRSLGEEAAAYTLRLDLLHVELWHFSLLQPSAWISKKLASFTRKANYSVVNKTLHHQL